MEFGISTFGEIVPDHKPGNAMNAHKRVQELLQEAKLADEIGLDVFALGEHHRSDYVVSAPEMILAGAATITKNIKFISAVTVLSSADPVRIFQNFSTLDLISNGRAEIMAGRGSFIESFPLFGYKLEDYDELFIEKLDLLLNINQHERVNWNGTHRASINNLGVYPRPYQQQLPIWIAVGGTPASVVRAGSLNLPLTIAILGGNPLQFTSLTNLYRNAAKKAGHDVNKLQLCINEHLYVADTAEQARDEFWPIYGRIMNKIGKERGWSLMTKQQFEYLCLPDGPLLVGSVKEITEKLIYQYKVFNNTRFLAQIISGDIEHEKIRHSIELFGKEVVAAVKAGIPPSPKGSNATGHKNLSLPKLLRNEYDYNLLNKTYKMNTLENKVAYITGGSKGIGYGIAKVLLDNGMNVAITNRSLSAAKQAAKNLSTDDSKILALQSDVSNPESETKAVQQTIEHFGKLDVLIANAGVGHFASIEELTAEQWKETIDTNLTGVFNSVKASINALKQTQGYIITIASLAGTNFFVNGSAYNASKFGLVGFSQAIMLDLRQYGIKVTTIMPGSVASHFNDHTPSGADAWKIQPEDIGAIITDLLKMHPRTLPSKVEVRPTVPGK